MGVKLLSADVTACSRHDFENTALAARDGKLHRLHRNLWREIGDEPDNVTATGHRLYACAANVDGDVNIVSSLTNECVAQIDARSSDLAIGVNTAAWVCLGGVKACSLMAPNQISWAYTSENPLRIAFVPKTNNLVVVECHTSRPVANKIDLSQHDFKKKRTSALNTQRPQMPTMIGPITCLGSCYASFVVVVGGKAALYAAHIDDSSQSFARSLAIGDMLAMDYRIDADKSYGIVNKEGCWATLAMESQNLACTFKLCYIHGPRRLLMELPRRAFLSLKHDGKVVLCHSGMAYALSGAIEQDQQSLNINFVKMHSKTHLALCRSCRHSNFQNNTTPICNFCSTANTKASAFGAACAFVRNQYNYILTSADANMLKRLFVYAPKCALTGNSWDKCKLIFVAANNSQHVVSVKHLILIDSRVRTQHLSNAVLGVGRQRWNVIMKKS